MQITVLGKGTFGKAIGSLLEYNAVQFAYVDVDLPMVEKADMVFITVPTQHIREALQTNARFFTQKTVFINCAKGIEEQTHKLPHQIVTDLLTPAQYFSLVGPSFATEIVEQQPTLVSLGYTRKTHVTTIKNLLQTPYFRIQGIKGYESLELAGAFKNVYAIICGFAHGLGFASNTRAKLITIALQEYAALAKAMGYRYESVAIPAIVGDLVLTCSSTESRNFTFGVNLATQDAKKALEKSGSTVEGYFTSHSIQAVANTYGVTLPLADLTHTIITGKGNAKDHFNSFVTSL